MTSASHAEGRQFDPGQVYVRTFVSALQVEESAQILRVSQNVMACSISATFSKFDGCQVQAPCANMFLYEKRHRKCSLRANANDQYSEFGVRLGIRDCGIVRQCLICFVANL